MMRVPGQYVVALFQSVSAVMKAESALKAAGAPFKIIPVPKEISSECGICIRFLPADRSLVEPVLVSCAVVFEAVDY